MQSDKNSITVTKRISLCHLGAPLVLFLLGGPHPMGSGEILFCGVFMAPPRPRMPFFQRRVLTERTYIPDRSFPTVNRTAPPELDHQGVIHTRKSIGNPEGVNRLRTRTCPHASLHCQKQHPNLCCMATQKPRKQGRNQSLEKSA